MHSTLWERIDHLFEQALEHPVAERKNFVRQACDGDEELLAEVLKLLEADREAPEFMETPAMPRGTPTDVIPEETWSDEVGAHFGPYRLLKLLGRGGMGAVYLAERDDDLYRRQVAIKVIRNDLPYADLYLRFRTERQVLAGLEHPNIARLYDGGSTEDGRPYLVMEYIEGLPLDVYCDRNRLSIDERLKLFCQVCSAVHHAHRNLLVHRDIKPGNILVTPGGVPKLLDFGIVKLLDLELAEEETEDSEPKTRTGVRLMTPSYASPEQVRGEAITTGTDVYALGVLLFRLLTGRGPYPVRSLLPHEIERQICEELPERPSKVLASSDAKSRISLEKICEARRTNPAELRRSLQGDLDTITLMAMRKEPERRYSSAQQLAEDIGRYLDNRPVMAQPDTFWYQGKKFIRRNALAVAAGALLAILLLSFSTITAFQASRIARERETAQRERAKAEQVSEFLMELFEDSEPSQAQGDEITVRQVLDRGALKVNHLQDEPELQAAYMNVIGRVYLALGLPEMAEPQLAQALDLRLQVHGEEHLEVAESLQHKAWLLYDQGKYQEAEPYYRRALDVRRRLLGDVHPDVIYSLHTYGNVIAVQGDFKRSKELFEEALALARQLPEEHVEVPSLMHSLAQFAAHEGDMEEAEELHREALAMRRRLLSETHPEVASGINNLALFLRSKGDVVEAEELLREALRLNRKIYGSAHPNIATNLNNLALTLNARGDRAGAEALYRESLAMRRELFGKNHPDVANALGNLATVLKDVAAAEELQREALSITRSLMGEDHYDVAVDMNNLAGILVRRGKSAEAEVLFRQALVIVEKAVGKKSRHGAVFQHNLANVLRDQGKFEEALPLYEKALKNSAEFYSENDLRMATFQMNHGLALVLVGQLEEAEEKLRKSAQSMRDQMPEGHWHVAQAEGLLGFALSRQGQFEEAEPLLVNSTKVMDQELGADDFRVQQLHKWMAEHYEARGMREKARQYRS